MSSLSLLHALRSWVAGIIVSIVVMTAIGGGGNGKNAVYAQEENNFDNNPAYKKIAANAYSLSPVRGFFFFFMVIRGLLV